MKTILITGSTDGIGKLAAIKLANDGHQLILHGRNTEKLQLTISELKTLSSNDKIDGYVSDLSDLESLKKMSADLSKEVSKIDVIINNAGVFKIRNAINKDGLDLRFVVNYLAPYVLTNGLISLLQKSSAPKVINLSSAAQSPVSIDALKGNEILSSQDAYAQSKLALTMWSFHLSKEHDFLNVIAVNPGSLLNTNMVKEAYGHHWSSADKGANIIYDLAVTDKSPHSSEKYFDNDKGIYSNAHNDAYDIEKITQLVFETKKILNL